MDNGTAMSTINLMPLQNMLVASSELSESWVVLLYPPHSCKDTGIPNSFCKSTGISKEQDSGKECKKA